MIIIKLDNKTARIILINIILFLLPTWAMGNIASNPNKPLKKVNTIIVDNYYPYTFVNAKGVSDGFSVDLIKSVTKVMGIDLIIDVDIWDKAKKSLLVGNIDFLPMMAYSKERDKDFDFSVPHTIAFDAFFVRKNTIEISTMNDLEGKKIIVMNNDQAHDYLRSSRIIRPENFILIQSVPEALQLLASGKGDAALMPKIVGLIVIRDLALSNLKLSPAVVEAYNRPFSFAVKDGNQLILERLNQGLSIVKETGQYNKIYEKWFGALEPKEVSLKQALIYILGIIGVLAFIGFTLLLWSISLRKKVASRTAVLENEVKERKNAEAALRESEEKFRSFADQSIVGIYLIQGGIFKYVNPKFAEIFNYSIEECLNSMPVNNLVHPSDLKLVEQQIAKRISGDSRTVHYTCRGIKKGGEIIFLEVYGSSVRLKGKLLAAGTVLDITERKEAEEIFKKQQDLLRKAQAIGKVGSWELDVKTEKLVWSDETYNIFGIPIGAELSFTIVMACVHPEDRENLRAKLELALTGKPYDIEYRIRVDGTIKWINEKAEFEFSKKGERIRVTGFVQDITDFKKIEITLIESEAFTKSVMDCLPIGIAVNSIGPDVEFEYTNDNFAKFYQTTKEALSEPNAFWNAVYEDPVYREKIKKRILDDCASGDPERMLWVDMPITRQGKETAYVTASNTPIPEKQLMISTVWDVTDRKNAEDEVRRLNRNLELLVHQRTTQLKEANKELEDFVYSVSHDLRAPLRSISGFAEIISRRYVDSLNEEGRHYFDNIVKAGKQMGILIDDLLKFSRMGGKSVIIEPLSLEKILESVLETLSDLIRKTKATIQLPDEYLHVAGDPTLTYYIFINLLENGIKYHKPEESPQIQVQIKNEDTNIIVAVSDNGIGIEAQYHEKIFKIFQRLHTQEEYPGTGIGLAAARKAAQMMDARIRLESHPGKGSTFFVKFKNRADKKEAESDQTRFNPSR